MLSLLCSAGRSGCGGRETGTSRFLYKTVCSCRVRGYYGISEELLETIRADSCWAEICYTVTGIVNFKNSGILGTFRG